MKLWTKQATATVLSVLCLLTFSLGLPAVAAADLPDGIIALSDAELSLIDAKGFCREQGGRLPFVNGTDFLEGYSDENKEQVTLDGFANIGAPWPDALPDAFFWTGTNAIQDNLDVVYLVSSGEGRVRAEIFYDINYRETTAYAACVRNGDLKKRGDPTIHDKDQAEAFLKKTSDDAGWDRATKGGAVRYVYNGEGEIGEGKAWFFDQGTDVAGKFAAEQRLAVNEHGEVWGLDIFNKWLKLFPE